MQHCNAFKTDKVFLKLQFLYFSQKMLISTFRFLSLPSSFRLSSQNLKYTRVLCFALFLFPFISWFISYCLMIRSIGLFEIIFHHFTFAENLHNVGDSVSVSLQQPTGFPSQTVLNQTPLDAWSILFVGLLLSLSLSWKTCTMWEVLLLSASNNQLASQTSQTVLTQTPLDAFSLWFLGNIVLS